MNQDLTRDNGITNPILHLTPIGIVFNYLRKIRRSYLFQQKCPGKAFLGNQEVNIIERSQNYEDFKSNSTLGERKPKNLTVVSTPLRKYTALV